MVLSASRRGRKCCLLFVLRQIGALFPASSSSSLNSSASKCRPLYSSIANSSPPFSHRYSSSSGLHPQLPVELLNVIEMRASEIERRSAHFQHTIAQEVVGLKSLIAECTEDKDMHEMARQELDEANEAVKELQCLLIKSLLPKDDADERDCILEVRAGTGGEEASLFAMELFKMYERYSLKKGWKFEVVDIMESDLKGCKEASGAISGPGAYGILKFESGIHRVQRVPVTEKSGRVHTSAVSVAILPQADEVDVQLRTDDLRIDTYRSGGSGGQHANTTNSAVRITHIPTGIVVSIQDERSQHMNKAKALKVLCAKLYETERCRLQASRSKLRSELIGSGDRSERIRTYNFPQGRVTDHRIGVTCHNIHDVLQGESLDVFIDGLLLQEETNAVASFASD
ncbi:peptide chain release factor 1, mitochondrial isoform X3 [Nymphaea colorata]|uniref:peptide chain release factor 1, mitochondrial isoform X3 n=1 Tax=Nymphaea colorata TaxID=210225 RepID=UPI00129E470A|nr:peptide chain release factor 1, mitochondrial isoform X3 [Nymphaea colorata]